MQKLRVSFVALGLLSLCIMLATPGKLSAQSDLGRISGFVKDPSGAAVANAKITVNASGIQREATTNESGYYVISNVPPGIYSMTAEAPGFQKSEITNNKLDPSADLVIDANLTVGSTSETIEV